MPVGGQGKNVSIFQQIEATEGVKPTGNYRRLPVKSFTLAPNENLAQDVVLSSAATTRDPLDPYRDFIDITGEAVVPLDLTNIGHWLRMLLGSPTTTGTTNLTHVFRSGSNALPSVAIEKVYSDIAGANEGYLGVRANTLSVPIQQSGVADATFGLMALAHTPNLTSAPGTPTTATFERFNRFQGSVSRNGAALPAFMQGTLTFSNGMEAVKAIRNDRRIEGIDWAETSAQFEGTVRLTAANAAILTDAIAGTPCSLAYQLQINAQRSLTLELPRVTLAPIGPRLEGPMGIDLPVRGLASFDSTAACMFRVTLLNQTAAY
ncbi:hypothetical protein KTR66_19375 [Roseococcus sp. SDR]|uniref:phage tail tube protein n=1 Tax=Roseococcus sp. SDR TaxID=2835532 RepID=UPI001BD14C25|nr:phage tail tube protein [Roseococcus sp. SDR]MBS7792169.1 hypothetical protein [Roseococcus sp. SDR]MBV1847483.1 hypothetical protein [Roseococcus sp. SDR]